MVSADKPLIRICAFNDFSSTEEYAEIEFETQDEANAAVEQLNEILRNAKGVTFKAR